MSSSTVLMSHQKVAATPTLDCGEDLVDVRTHGLQDNDPKRDAAGTSGEKS
ncbi:hypothetical protein [Streptomyces sp. NPDC058305]|uniref:hypothetical protein n=1 Tax=Streptomyces sp. NPDC058305 TaxID=3346438 RepID=UPI0036F07F89